MAIRTINYSVSSDGISPKTEQRAGLQSEHAVTQLVFTLDNTLYQALLDEKQDGDTLVYRFDCIDSTGGTVRTESTELTDSVITFTVGENLTRNGGKARVYLVISRYNAVEETEIEMLSFPARLRFENVPASDNGNSRESLSTLTEAAKNAAKRSKESAESAKQSADTAEKLIDKVKDDITELQNGGYVADAQKISEKINDWLNAHPEATTTVQDGSILLKHLNNELKEYISASVNVKDFGAVGDGITNDEQAIKNAFDYAINNLPCEVYFPKGEYGILNGGITVKMPLGSGGLTVRGDGYNLSKIKYLEDWTPSPWYAIRIEPVSTPTNESEYIHDIAYIDIGVYDPDPINHAWNPDKGDPDKEETHGFDLKYCIRGMVKNCKIENVGDEAIDIYSCIDTIVTNNFVIGSPAAGAAGGAISIGDGSKNVIVSNNTVSGSITTKENFGIAIESLNIPVSNVIIDSNIISNINGNGINIGAIASTSLADKILISNNIITNCINGIGYAGVAPKYIKISNNEIVDCEGNGINLGYVNELHIDNCKIKNVINGIKVTANTDDTIRSKITNCTILNIQKQAIFVNGDLLVSDCYINGVGLDGSNPSGGAIQQFSSDFIFEVENTKICDVQMTKGIQMASKLINVDVEFATGIIGYYCTGYSPKIINGGRTNGVVAINSSNSIISSLTLKATENLMQHAVVLNGVTGVSIIGCTIITTDSTYNAINGGNTADYNLIANNITKRPIYTVGANDIKVNNLQLV